MLNLKYRANELEKQRIALDASERQEAELMVEVMFCMEYEIGGNITQIDGFIPFCECI